MSREIKFRAWLKPRWDDDDDANTMYYDIQNSYDMLGDVKPYDPMGCFSGWLDEDIAVVEQYTGLKDKNGKEIYEGDIVRCWDDCCGKVYFDETLLQYCVKFNDGDYEDLASSEPETIGTIHENPDLLKKGGKE